MFKPRAVAWRASARIHLVDVDEFGRHPEKTFCGQHILYGDVFELDQSITCRKCLHKLGYRGVREETLTQTEINNLIKELEKEGKQ